LRPRDHAEAFAIGLPDIPFRPEKAEVETELLPGEVEDFDRPFRTEVFSCLEG
jgi:hypothetical protein